jgi:arylsulfatase A-like enzyme
MEINPYFLLLLIFFLISCDTPDDRKPSGEDLPNVVWLVSEDNSPFIGVYGDTLAVTPNIDQLAREGIVYENAFANAPVCAPSRSTLITGMYATSLGTQHMRCKNPVPEFVRFFPAYLREAGYFTTNRQKTDYNTFDQEGVWDRSWWDWKDALTGRTGNQPFFLMYNTWMSHEDKIHSDEKAEEYYRVTLQALLGREFTEQEIADSLQKFGFEAGDIPIPPYHPPTDAMYSDWARYYNRIQMMDQEVGIVMELLKKQGLLDNTIVFYFSDHGGVLPRSKRFAFESGLKVPLIIRFPEKYSQLAPSDPGTRIRRLVSFVDFAPAVLGLIGIRPPDHMEGNAFLGDFMKDPEEIAWGFRGRMDERYDIVRTLRDENYRYRLNFMPHRPYGQHIRFLWRAPSMQSWELAYRLGETDRTQSRFFSPKVQDELYDIRDDPHCVNNLALNPANRNKAERYRKKVIDQMIRAYDTGILPEALLMELSEGSTPYAYVHNLKDKYAEILESALVATSGKRENLAEIETMLTDDHPAIRYWGATGCVILREGAMELKETLLGLLEDEYPTVRIAAAEALYEFGETGLALNSLRKILRTQFQNLLTKEKTVSGFASEVFELTHAINVITFFDDQGSSLAPEIQAIAEKEKPDYAKRAAEYLVFMLDQ